MNDNILNKSAFDCLDDNVKNSLYNLKSNMNGKTYEQKLAMIVAFVQSLPKGITLTKKEKQAMLEAVMEDMSESEKKRMSMLIGLIGM